MKKKIHKKETIAKHAQGLKVVIRLKRANGLYSNGLDGLKSNCGWMFMPRSCTVHQQETGESEKMKFYLFIFYSFKEDSRLG